MLRLVMTNSVLFNLFQRLALLLFSSFLTCGGPELNLKTVFFLKFQFGLEYSANLAAMPELHYRLFHSSQRRAEDTPAVSNYIFYDDCFYIVLFSAFEQTH